MRLLVQRSKEASVTIDGKVHGKIDFGLVVLVGFTHTDTEAEIDYLIDKLLHLRIFNDENGVMNRSLLDVGGEILSISQFTLYADTRKGRRPSYIAALNGDAATKLYDVFNQKIKEKGVKIETGIFGSDMKVALINDGPTTILLEKKYDKK